MIATHQHVFRFDDVHGAESKGICACGEERTGRNFLSSTEVDQLEQRQGIAQMPYKRREPPMPATPPNTPPTKPPPLPIELGPDAMNLKILSLQVPTELTNGNSISSIDISGDPKVISTLAMAYKQGQLTVTLNLT